MSRITLDNIEIASFRVTGLGEFSQISGWELHSQTQMNLVLVLNMSGEAMYLS